MTVLRNIFFIDFPTRKLTLKNNESLKNSIDKLYQGFNSTLRKSTNSHLLTFVECKGTFG